MIIKFTASYIINYMIKDNHDQATKNLSLKSLYYFLLSFPKILFKLLIFLAIYYLLYLSELMIKSSILFCLIIKTNYNFKIYRNIVSNNFSQVSSNKKYNKNTFKLINLWYFKNNLGNFLFYIS